MVPEGGEVKQKDLILPRNVLDSLNTANELMVGFQFRDHIFSAMNAWIEAGLSKSNLYAILDACAKLVKDGE